MKTSPFKVFALSVCVLLISSQTNYLQCLEKEQKLRLQKINASYTSMIRFNINNISTWIKNDGTTDFYLTDSGFEFPKGSGKHAVFLSGLLWGAKVNDTVKVGGTYYSTGLQPGRILGDGSAENKDADNVRIYRVMPDYKTSSLDSEINQYEGTYEEVYARYEKDWNEWPGNLGAPFEDVNQNGIYEPSIDIPGIKSADQTLWFVANDLNKSYTENLAGSKPIGVELQVTVWGYNDSDYKDNIVFKKYRLINKSNYQLKDMYFNFYSDVDIGDAGDDLCGSDASLNLGYVYNGDDDDFDYGSAPPALGSLVLQGPIIDGLTDDKAIFNGQLIPGKDNLPMTAFFHFYCGGPNFFCPQLGEYEDGTLSWYNYFQGIEGLTDHPFMIPDQFGGGTTMYTLNGDPVTGTGWIDGIERNMGDRYINLTSGPFTMNPNDVQEIVIAQIVGDGNNRLESITILRDYATSLINDYENYLYESTYITGIEDVELPTDFILHQNYPNPFNPTTTIEYTIHTPTFGFPSREGNTRGVFTTLKVYDILGREITTLVSEYQQPGNYSVEFNVETFHGTSLPSGVYFYTLRVWDSSPDKSGSEFAETKKMVLIK